MTAATFRAWLWQRGFNQHEIERLIAHFTNTGSK